MHTRVIEIKYIHGKRVILPALEDKTTWFCDPPTNITIESVFVCLHPHLYVCLRGVQVLLAGLRGACALTAALTLPLLLLYFSSAVGVGRTSFISFDKYYGGRWDTEKNKVLLPALSQTGGIGK